jgi:hypothetical protein
MIWSIYTVYVYILTDCKGSADIMYGGTVALGCDAFLKAQENACSCSKSQSDSNHKSKRKSDPKHTPPPASIKKDKTDRATSGRRNDEL